jgi:hypothetical protein
MRCASKVLCIVPVANLQITHVPTVCYNDEMLLSSFAVFDKDYMNCEDNLEEWQAFRASYPNRSFCLLIPWPHPDGLDLTIPPEVLDDKGFKVHSVTRTKSTLPCDDWFTIS